MKRFPALLALPLLALAVAGCGSSSSSSSAAATSSDSAPTPAAATGGAIQVTMMSLAFSPDVVHAKVGQTIQWTNNDTPPHNVTYVSGPKFTSSKTMDPGATFQVKLTQAGTIHYFCSIHPFMKATIVVTS
jgi:plastocyanin